MADIEIVNGSKAAAVCSVQEAKQTVVQQGQVVSMLGKIAIADDHAVIREALRSLLVAKGEWEVVAEASDGFQVLPMVEKFCPDILVLDLSMPNLGGIETLSRLDRLRFRPTVLILSARDDEVSVREAFKAGAKGFVPKSASAEELHFALQALSKGQTYLSPSVSNGLLSQGGDGKEESPIAILSTREREVMKLLCEGHPNREVAKMLHISPRTIDTHRTNIMKKLGLESNAELVQLAVRCGLIE